MATKTRDYAYFFGAGFMPDHLGQIMDDPRIAIVELVANAYDAGATRVEIDWPNSHGQPLRITDNGIGMTEEQFKRRWRTLKYDRTKEQGSQVEFPGSIKGRRRAFGHNGKGRFSPFCFADDYKVETWRDGGLTGSTVTLLQNEQTPFALTVDERGKREGSGTTISCVVSRKLLNGDQIREAIGFKFGVVPTFEVIVNGQLVKLFDLKSIKSYQITVENIGAVDLHRLDPKVQERTKQLKGLVWWVNKRVVGEPSWDGLDEGGKYLDGRTSEAKRFSYVVEADCLEGDDIRHDWTFGNTHRVQCVKAAVHKYVVEDLRTLLADDRKQYKKEALKKNEWLIRDLPLISRRQIGTFLDEAQEKCPALTVKDLAHTVEIWGKLEQSRSGFDLLEQLAKCSVTDLDKWNQLMQNWTATNAEIVLNELDRRLLLIGQLEQLVMKSCDEVHDLQPLFERGLWMFGPEYESVEFTSNRRMVHVVQEFFGKKGVAASTNRPDFVALPDSSIGLYAADSHKEGEVSGVRKVLIVELKRGGFTVGLDELDQARGYALELRSRGCVQDDTIIDAFVLGATLKPGLKENSHGKETTCWPRTYDHVLRQAHARVFNLAKRIRESAPMVRGDSEVENILSEQLLDRSATGAPGA